MRPIPFIPPCLNPDDELIFGYFSAKWQFPADQTLATPVQYSSTIGIASMTKLENPSASRGRID